MTFSLETTPDVFLGPATVLEAKAEGAGNRVQLALPSGVAVAELALALPVNLQAGDVVLAIGKEERYYVIGVLHHLGKATFTFPADVEIRAPRGAVQISAGKRVDVSAPELTARAGRIQLVARFLVQRLGTLLERVKDLVHRRGGRKNEQIDGISYQRAERVYTRAERDVKINGERIHLG